MILFRMLMDLVRYAVRQRTHAAQPFKSSALLWWMAFWLPRYVMVPQLRNLKSLTSASPLFRSLARCVAFWLATWAVAGRLCPETIAQSPIAKTSGSGPELLVAESNLL